jgi:hypothetical protein
MSRFALPLKMSALALLVLPALPACDPPDEFGAEYDEAYDDEEFGDEEVAERDLFTPTLNWPPTIDLSKLPQLFNINSLPQSQAWVAGHDSQIIVLDSVNSSNEVFAYQVDLDTRQVLAARSASGRGTDLRRGHPIPLRSVPGDTLVPVDPAQKSFLIERNVSYMEFGGNLHIAAPKGPPKGDDPIFTAKVQVLAISAAKGYAY